MLPQIDSLIGLLFEASGTNPQTFLPQITEDKQALIYYEMARRSLLGKAGE